MAGYDQYDRDYGRRYAQYDRPDPRADPRADPRYLDSRDYGRQYSNRDLVPRGREGSDLSVEEIRRDFPPPTGRDIRRARSAEVGGYYDDDYDNRRSHGSSRRGHDGDRSPRGDRHARGGPGSVHYEEETHKKHKTMSKEEKIMAAVAGAALLAGGKELYDRYEAKESGSHVQRNALSTAALAGVGAIAAYQGIEFYNKQQQKKDQKTSYILHQGRDGHVEEYYDDDEDAGPQEKKGNKNFLESALAATGLGAAVKSLTGGGDYKHSDTRSRRGSENGSPSRSGGGSGNKIQKAAMASLLAGATEAFRVAKEPGSWKGEKAKRILTAAAGAATVDAVHGDKHGAMGLAESVIGGLVGTRLINGSRKDIEEDSVTGRSRSRSRARSGSRGAGAGLAALATAGLGALGAKKVLDNSRSQSRGRAYDSRTPSPDGRRRSRSRSVVDRARDGLAKLGIGAGAGAVAADQYRNDRNDRSPRRSRGYSDEEDDYDDYGRGQGRGQGQGQGRYNDQDDRQVGRRNGNRDRSGSRGGQSGDSTDLGDSDEDEKKAKKLKGKQLLTSGLAAIATIHAGHQVYSSMEKRKARKKALNEGEISEGEAKKLKTKSMWQDAAAVGIAAIGIKSAVEEMKELKDMRKECHEFEEEKMKRHERREERRRKQLQGGSSNGRGRSDSYSDESQSPPRAQGRLDRYDDGYADYDDYGPRYRDANPYGSAAPLPAPPIGRRAR